MMYINIKFILSLSHWLISYFILFGYNWKFVHIIVIFKEKNIHYMGLSESKDKAIDIYLEIEKPCYESGDIIKGKVYLNVK